METTTTEQIIQKPAEDLLAYLSDALGSNFWAIVLTVVITLLVTAFVAHACTRLLRRLLSKEGSPLPSSSIFINIARICIWGMGVGIILSTCFNVDVTAAIAALGIGGIALSLGFQDTLSNMIGGLQLSVLGVVEPGDNIEISGQRGVVQDVTWRHVIIETATGSRVVVPNSVINKNSFVQLPPAEKIVVPIIISKNVVDLHDLSDRMVAAVTEALASVTTVEKPIKILFDSTTELGYSGSIIIWIDSHEDGLAVKDAAVRALAPFYDPREEDCIIGGDGAPAAAPSAAPMKNPA